MIIKINGVPINPEPSMAVVPIEIHYPNIAASPKKSPWPAAFVGTMSAVIGNVTPALAATSKAMQPMDGLWPLIAMIQLWCKPIGITLALWGLVDWALGNPEGKKRMKIALIMYIGVFLIPTVFDTIDRSFSGMGR